MPLRVPIRWTEFAHMRFTGRDPFKPKIDKTRTAALIRETGLRGPEIYGVFDRIEDVPFARLPRRFVLKPTGLNGKRGVMLLTRTFYGADFWDIMKKQRLTVAQVIAEQKSWSEMHHKKYKQALRFIAEELIVGENGAGFIPFDYKVYVFAGAPKFVLQLDRNVKPPAAAFFDGAFAPMAEPDPRVTRGPTTQVGKARVPRCAKDILASAATLSRALDTPFISIDCYAGVAGAVIGEITVIPGGPYARSAFAFSDEFDLEMGRHWTEALARTNQPVPLYDESWTEEPRQTSGLPIKLRPAPTAG